MASHHLTAGHVGSTSALERYLTELSARLRGPRGARTRVLAEIHDGLTEAIDAHLADGMPPDAAAATAIAEFGDPATVARSFAANWPPLRPAHHRDVHRDRAAGRHLVAAAAPPSTVA